jgi:hypothetical protein
MPKHYYLIRYEDKLYANNELYKDAIAGGEKALLKMLSSKKVVGLLLMDQILYPLDPEEENACETIYNPTYQDFDSIVRSLNVLSKGTIKEIQSGGSEAFPGAAVISIRKEMIPKFYRYRHVTFFKATDYKEGQKYNMLPKMATVKICGRLYVAVNAVSVRVETPIIATLVD